MQIDCESRGDALVAVVRGRVDTVSAPAFEKSLAAAVDGAARWLVVDLAELTYISSAGLRVFLSAAKQLKARGAELRLAGARGSVHKVLEVSGFFTLFKHFDTPDAALDGS